MDKLGTSEQALLKLAQIYHQRVTAAGGRSLARVATIVVNRGSFFSAMHAGSTCSLRNFDKLVAYFSAAEHWPERAIPAEATEILAGFGHLISQEA